MKLGMAFANIGPFTEPPGLVRLAQAAENAGLESLWTVEHVLVPVGYQSTYPYSAEGRMPGPENAPIPDPLLWLSYVAAVTERIRLATGILILPQRHPAIVAKEVATLDRLSGGRVILGVGIGWLKEEFDALDVPFDQRVARTEEGIEALRSLWGAEPSAFSSSQYQWGEVESNPKPVQQPGVPIVVGGHVKAAARRAARLGDGFFPGRADKLDELLAELGAECARIGRDPAEIEITGGGSIPTLDDLKRAEDRGIHRWVMPPPAFDPDELESALARLADEVVAKL
ncbi:MAG: LLM class F420-dependent oxidoreductase [Proteobacteria bacterium]|nr:LLM class F420-dependent oxidoreductase [Pseudomonadota bacterium]